MRERYSYQLSRFEKNDLFRVIEGSAVPVSGFELSEEHIKLIFRPPDFLFPLLPFRHREPRTVTVIRHAGTSSVFGVVQTQYACFLAQYETGGRMPESVVVREWVPFDDIGWPDVLKAVNKWVDEIQGFLGDAEIPDLWERLKHDRSFLGSQAAQDIENTPFTVGEQAEISAELHRIKNHLHTTPELASAPVSEIETRLEHLENASERVGRKDWLMMFNGAITSLILSDLLPAQTAQHIIVMAVQGLGHLFGMGTPPHLLSSGMLT
jgi:hypothetical protein